MFFINNAGLVVAYLWSVFLLFGNGFIHRIAAQSYTFLRFLCINFLVGFAVSAKKIVLPTLSIGAQQANT
jgi:hypothetical protein